MQQSHGRELPQDQQAGNGHFADDIDEEEGGEGDMVDESAQVGDALVIEHACGRRWGGWDGEGRV